MTVSIPDGTGPETVATPNTSAVSKRFGGELPLGCDPLLREPMPLPINALCFSHGRAALSWLIQRRGPFRSAALCAYTCPTVPQHLEGRGLDLGFFDYGERDIASTIGGLPDPCLVLLPAPFGMAPWIDPAELADRLDKAAMVVIDAAQSAFGYSEFAIPPGGAVLSCPRKCLALGDGALLSLEAVTDAEFESVATLPDLASVSLQKQSARALFAQNDQSLELQALALAKRAEDALPGTPHRMTEASLAHFSRVDSKAHGRRRRANAHRLARRLRQAESAMPTGKGTPFNFPILVDDRDVMVKRLHSRRVFATPLWPSTRHDPGSHPTAADMARRLLALPIDQRYSLSDMDQLADIVQQCL